MTLKNILKKENKEATTSDNKFKDEGLPRNISDKIQIKIKENGPIYNIKNPKSDAKPKFIS